MCKLSNIIIYQQESTRDIQHDVLGTPVSFSPLFKSIRELKRAATEINAEKKVIN